MESPPDALLSCPTRSDATEALISQTIARGACQSRQRGRYHKCWTCEHRNGASRPQVAPLYEFSASRAAHDERAREAV